MEEFVEGFTEFREWLYNVPAISPDAADLLAKIKDKFESLGLDDAF